MKYCMIEVAFDKREEVEQVGKCLLDKHLVSSCQVVESNSVWNYKGERETAKEYLLFLKTRIDLQKEIYQEIRRIHSYECFEFAVFPFTSCSDSYLNWIGEETR